jgi:hypothetical protein
MIGPGGRRKDSILLSSEYESGIEWELGSEGFSRSISGELG